MLLKKVRAKKIKDSRGEPTIEVTINGASASAPAGKSTGKFETRPYKKSLNWNINFLKKTSFDFEINSFNDLKKVESFLKRKLKVKDAKKFGANALVALEVAILKALANSQKKQLWQIINPKEKKLPTPVGNCIEGGLHAHNPNHPLFQEFLIIPQEKKFSENFRMMKKIHHELKKISETKRKTEEGAWETQLSNEQVFSTLSKFQRIKFGTDIAASEFYKNSRYIYKKRNLRRKEQIHQRVDKRVRLAVHRRPSRRKRLQRICKNKTLDKKFSCR